MEFSTPERSDCRDSLRMSPKEQDEILSELEGRSARQRSSERRTDERLRYVQSALLFLQVRHPGGTTSNYLVRTRNLSKTGIGFLHGSFLYSGTPCTVSLRTPQNKFVDVEGTVVRCSHVRGHIHDVGVKFVKPVKLRDFMGQAAPINPEETVSTELPQLTGKVLHIEDSPDDQDLLKFHLESLGVSVHMVPSALEALEVISSIDFDLIISGIWLPGMSEGEIAQMLRQTKYKGPIIALTADERDETRIEALERGCTAVLTKPYRFEDLLHLLTLYLRPAPNQAKKADGPIVSEKWGDVLMRPLITRFLGRLDGQLAQIQRLIGVSGTEPLVQKLCMDLKGSAGGFGFPQISKASAGLLELLMDNPQLNEVHRSVDELATLCNQAVKAMETLQQAEPKDEPPVEPAAPPQ